MDNSNLNFEGPESVNAAASLLPFGILRNNFVGTDLGTCDKNNDRSKDAAGASPRSWDLEYQGNKTNTVFTNQNQLDSLRSLENMINTFLYSLF